MRRGGELSRMVEVWVQDLRLAEGMVQNDRKAP